MDSGIYSEEEFEVLEAAIEGIHKARLSHRIIATFATKADSVLLAHAAIDAIRAVGFKIVRDDEAEIAG